MKISRNTVCTHTPQAMVGAAFSLGFMFGPSIGAAFSVFGRTEDSFLAFQYPALFALSLTLLNIGLVTWLMPETLPAHQRVGRLHPTLTVLLLYAIHC